MPKKIDLSKISDITQHNCKLDPLDKEHELPEVAPYAPPHEKTFNIWLKWAVASPKNPNCRKFFRSGFTIYKERRRQLRSRKYRFVIHPLSRLVYLRDVFMVITWILNFFLEPCIRAFYSDYVEKSGILYLDLLIFFFNIVFTVDIVFQFVEGYTIDRTKEIILDRKEIARHYLKTFFFFDVVPTLANYFYLFMKFEEVSHLVILPTNFLTWINFFNLYCLRWPRIYTVRNILSDMLLFYKFQETVVKCINIAILNIIVIHWFTCIVYLIPTMYHFGYPNSTWSESSWIIDMTRAKHGDRIEIYAQILLATVCHYFGAGKGNIMVVNPIEQTVFSCILIIGLLQTTYVTAFIIHLFGTINVSETKYEELIYQLNQYANNKKLPINLKKRLLMYYEYRFQKRFFMEELILNTLSEHLRYEIQLYSCKNIITKVKVFQGASKTLIGTLVAMFQHEIFLPNDYISKSIITDNVYFISFGTIAEYVNGKEAYHMEDGNHFGEYALFHNDWEIYRNVSIVALEITEVFYIKHKDFLYIVGRNPEIKYIVEKGCAQKQTRFQELVAPSDEHIIDSSNILVQLKKHKILERSKKRV